MIKAKAAASCALCVITVGAVHAETTTYTYDPLGRLSKVQVSGGAANGAQADYYYDAAGNRTQYLVSGSTGSGVITIVPAGTTANQVSDGVVLGVHIVGSAPATGTVTFSENGTFLGSALVYDGQASVYLEGFSLGTHTITASYSGDSANAPYSYTFTIKVQRLAWLPAVLQILLE